MKNAIAILFLTVGGCLAVSAQPEPAKKPTPVGAVVAGSTSAEPLAIAKATLAAHGGDKLKNIKSLITRGSCDITAFGQAMPGVFSIAFSGDKYFFEINSAVQSLKQVYDGSETYSSIAGFSLPPVTSLGFPLLPRVGDAGYVVSIPESAKKKKGFRITTPEGFYTDFFINEKTGQVKSYESSYDVGGRIITTSVEIDGYETVDGIVVPSKYAQKFDLGQLTAYANFKSKSILVNSKIEDSAFALPK